MVLVCATRGQMGKPGDADVSGAPTDVGAAREQELRDAVRIIGIRHLRLLDYQDRQLADANVHDVRRDLVGCLRRYRPDVVVTFDPNGFNLHPDHVAISRFTSDAIAASADGRWLPETGAAHVVRRLLWTPPLPPWEVARSANIAAEPGADFIVDITPWRDRKAAALRAHRTQHRSVDRHFFDRPDLEKILSAEVYRHAWGPSLAARPEGDIFSGLD